MLENKNNSIGVEAEVKFRPIFVPKVSNLLPLRQLLKEVTNGEFDLRVVNPEKIKIQPKSSIAYINIVKKLKIRNIEFHIYKLK